MNKKILDMMLLHLYTISIKYHFIKEKNMKINSYLIKNYITEKNISPKMLAEKCGISHHCMKQILSGDCKVKIDKLYKLCAYTKLKANNLLFL